MDPAFQVVIGPAENITANAVKALAAAHMHKVAQQNNTRYYSVDQGQVFLHEVLETGLIKIYCGIHHTQTMWSTKWVGMHTGCLKGRGS